MHPKILEFGPLTIHTYGLLLAAAFIAGIWITSRNAKKKGMNADLVWNMGLLVIFAALVGSKVILFISDPGNYSQHPGELFSLSTLRNPGAIYGGLLLALVSAFWYMKKKQIPVGSTADLSVPGIAFGQAIASMGCLMTGCCYGKPSHLPWSITFISEYAYKELGGLPDIAIPRHPTQIYESAAAFCLFVFLMWRLSKKRFNGQILLEYLGLYSLIRFVIEFYRGDERGFMLHDLLSTSQFIAILTMLGSAVAYYLLRRPREIPQN
jgi:phosphatidylglycerol---prolipoprotein diacylglyceryl transferase